MARDPAWFTPTTNLLRAFKQSLRPFSLFTCAVCAVWLLKKAGDEMLRISDTFPAPPPLKLLGALDESELECIVSKKSDQLYVSGRDRGWNKVKRHAWSEANRESAD
jgi:hypothetical protein